MVAQLLADNRPQVLPMLMQYGREYRQLTEEKLERLVDNLQNKVKQLADVLSLQLPEGTDYRDILIAAHSRLSAVAEETAEDMLTAQVNSQPAAKEEDALLAEVHGLSQAISGLAARPKEKPMPAAAVPAAARAIARRQSGMEAANSPAHSPSNARTAAESPQTYRRAARAGRDRGGRLADVEACGRGHDVPHLALCVEHGAGGVGSRR